MPPIPQIILSSSSIARRELLARLNLSFTSVEPDIDETPLANESVEKLVLRLALQKAQAVQKQFPEALIIGSDQVGVLDDTFLGKPLTYENAVKQLQMKSGKKVRFYNGLCLLDTRNNTHELALETYDVYIRNLTDEMIHTYLQKENVLHCAGSLHIEGLGISLVEKFDGDDYTALIGLPLIRLTTMLGNAGVCVI